MQCLRITITPDCKNDLTSLSPVEEIKGKPFKMKGEGQGTEIQSSYYYLLFLYITSIGLCQCNEWSVVGEPTPGY